MLKEKFPICGTGSEELKARTVFELNPAVF
jgi:hypothetical protein